MFRVTVMTAELAGSLTKYWVALNAIKGALTASPENAEVSPVVRLVAVAVIAEPIGMLPDRLRPKLGLSARRRS